VTFSRIGYFTSKSIYVGRSYIEMDVKMSKISRLEIAKISPSSNYTIVDENRDFVGYLGSDRLEFSIYVSR